jgi:ArsR family transcriptional regulator, arsenate/arsenite/antimonite-responsive transcriptional repressor
MAKELVELFKALGDFSRLRIIRILASNMEDEICVTDIASLLGVSTSAVSQHIRILKSLGILVAEKKGFRVYYHINTATLTGYKKMIDQMFEVAFKKCGEYPECDEG